MYTRTNFAAIVFITLFGLAMAAPILDPSPYDPLMDTADKLDVDEEITCLNYQDCIDMFGMEINEPEPNYDDMLNEPCVVICDSQDEGHLDRCDVPFTVLSAISADVVANYSTHNKLLIHQVRNYMDFIIRAFDPSEYEILDSVLDAVFRQITSNAAAMREIIHNVEHYLVEVESDTECSGLLDIWFGYKVLKMAGML